MRGSFHPCSSSGGEAWKMRQADVPETLLTPRPPASTEGVLVEAQLGDVKIPCSGVMFGGGRWVLTHGALLSALHAFPHEDPRVGELVPPTAKLRSVRVHIEREHGGPGKAKVAAWWRCPYLNTTGQQLYAQGWRFGPSDDDANSANTLGLLLVLSLKEGLYPPKPEEVREALNLLLEEHVLPAKSPSPGDHVLLEATPFGLTSLFLNSWSRGVVSSVSGEAKTLLLCDAHAAPGCEGGAIYTSEGQRSHLLGMVLLPFFMVRGEAVTMCLAAALAPVLTRVLQRPESMVTSNSLCVPESPAVGGAGVVLVRHGATWASGVVINAARDLILTCAHVLQSPGVTRVQWVGGGAPITAEVLYQSSPGVAYDLALLRVLGVFSTAPDAPRLALSLPVKGESVVVAGYGLLTPPEESCPAPPPLLSRGCLSVVKRHMLQTTCAVQSGASGGAVFREATGELLGVVVGHMRAISSGPLPKDWSRLNFAVPVSAIVYPVANYLRTGDVSKLQELQNADPNVQSLWQLDEKPKSKL